MSNSKSDYIYGEATRFEVDDDFFFYEMLPASIRKRIAEANHKYICSDVYKCYLIFGEDETLYRLYENDEASLHIYMKGMTNGFRDAPAIGVEK